MMTSLPPAVSDAVEKLCAEWPYSAKTISLIRRTAVSVAAIMTQQEQVDRSGNYKTQDLVDKNVVPGADQNNSANRPAADRFSNATDAPEGAGIGGVSENRYEPCRHCGGTGVQAKY